MQVTISGSDNKIESQDSNVVQNKDIFSYDTDDYFDMMYTKNTLKAWKSIVMDRSVGIHIGEQSLRLNKV